MTRRFDRVVIADWSASAALSPARPSADAIWLGSAGVGGADSRYFRSRSQAEAALCDEISTARQDGYRLLIGFDFPFGYPKGFAVRLTGQPSAAAVWAWLARHIRDDEANRNNRFDVAAMINEQIGAGDGPFWGRPATRPLAGLPERRRTINYSALGLPERRAVETVVPRAQPVWKLYTTGAAGSQGLMGQPMLHRLAALPDVAVWPFADWSKAPVVLAEVYPSLLAAAVRADAAPIKDEAQVRLLARALFRLDQQGKLDGMMTLPEGLDWPEEGWILAAGHAAVLAGVLA